MRHFLLGWLLAAVVSIAHAAAPASAPAAASAASGAVPALTPQQAQQALSVLQNPREREQVETTLRAIAAVGVLSTPALPASAAAPASAASAAAPAALTTNGLASMLVRQGSHWAGEIGGALNESLRSLLDVASVGNWWHERLVRADERADLLHALLTIVAVLVPALGAEWLARRLLRRTLRALGARRAESSRRADAAPSETEPPESTELPESIDPAASTPLAAGTPSASSVSSTSATPETQSRGHARRHTTLLHRMPRALVSLVVRAVPLLVFAGVASLTMSVLDGDGTPTDTALGSLIDIYVICRLVTIVSRLFSSPMRDNCGCCTSATRGPRTRSARSRGSRSSSASVRPRSSSPRASASARPATSRC
jgi:small conductance mechanosensitive channel